jgi:hypothetical protein
MKKSTTCEKYERTLWEICVKYFWKGNVSLVPTRALKNFTFLQYVKPHMQGQPQTIQRLWFKMWDAFFKVVWRKTLLFDDGRLLRIISHELFRKIMLF